MAIASAREILVENAYVRSDYRTIKTYRENDAPSGLERDYRELSQTPSSEYACASIRPRLVRFYYYYYLLFFFFS